MAGGGEFPTSVYAHLRTLQRRGVQVPDTDKAAHYIQRIGYYRLSEYIVPFFKGAPNESRPDRQGEALSFDRILELYKFDRKLRLLALDALERIEISIRSDIREFLVETYGENWLEKAPKEVPEDICDSIKRIIFQKNGSEGDGASRVGAAVAEPKERTDPINAITFGKTCRIFDFLPNQQKKRIARSYHLNNFKILRSCLRSLTTVRNISAHHERLWNIELLTTPKIPAKVLDQLSQTSSQPYDISFYGQALIIYYLLQKIARNTTWHTRLYKLIEENAAKITLISLRQHMGFPDEWHTEPFWNARSPIEP